MGRKTILTEEKIILFCEQIKTGIRRASAGALAGISEPSIYNYIKRAKEALEEIEESDTEGDTPKEDHPDWLYISFLEELLKTEAKREAKLIKEIEEEPMGARWILSHHPQYRKSFGNSLDINLSGDDGQTQYEINWPDQDKTAINRGEQLNLIEEKGFHQDMLDDIEREIEEADKNNE